MENIHDDDDSIAERIRTLGPVFSEDMAQHSEYEESRTIPHSYDFKDTIRKRLEEVSIQLGGIYDVQKIIAHFEAQGFYLVDKASGSGRLAW